MMICFRLSLVICFALAFKSSLCGSAVSVGVAKVDVTPKGPVLLAGYGGRTTEHQGVDTPLWARALVIGDEKRVAVVALDNCGVPQEVTNRLARRSVTACGTPQLSSATTATRFSSPITNARAHNGVSTP